MKTRCVISEVRSESLNIIRINLIFLKFINNYSCLNNCAQDFGGKSEGKRSLGKPRRRWENNIKMDLQEVG
jgi:hypothetical protein